MDQVAAITFRLESYLLQLSEANRRWGGWLGASEQAVAKLDAAGLNALLPVAEGLMVELRESLAARKQLLDDARALGLPSSDLTALAHSLPAWQKPSLRASLANARQQLSNLRRLHAASWVLMSRIVHYYSDMMYLLVQGQAERSVYLPDSQSDTGGGRLLDANL